MPETQPLDALGQWTISVMQELGYLGLAVLVTLEMVFPPIPSELVLPLAGFLTGQGTLSYPLAVLAATIGSTIGSLLLYWFGWMVGEQRLRVLIQRYGKWFLLNEGDLDKSYAWFQKYGSAAVFFGRLAPGVRSIVSIPAGVARMPMVKFLGYSTLGSASWNALLIGLGWLLGASWETATDYIRPLAILVVVVIAAVGLVIVWKRVSALVLKRPK